mgnify:CR=1 FL=1
MGLFVGAGATDNLVTVPDGAAAGMDSSSGLSSFDIEDVRLPMMGGERVSPGFGDAEHRVTITCHVGVLRARIR